MRPLYLLNIRETPKGQMVTACEADLLGETFTDGEARLAVEERFYSGEEADIAEIAAALEHMFTANIVGTALIEALIDADAVSADEVHSVDGIKHVQLFSV